MVTKLNVILKFERSKSVWVCPDCDTENELSCENCFTCDRLKPAYARIITPESERLETEEYISIARNDYQTDTATSTSTSTYGSTLSEPGSYRPSYSTPSKSGMSPGAIIAIIVILIFFGIIILSALSASGAFDSTYYSTFNNQAFDEVLTEYINTI